MASLPQMEATFRLLEPSEGAVLSEAIRVAYGESYDVRWVYDPTEVSTRLAAGTYVSCVAELPDGELLCHEGMSLGAAGDAVASQRANIELRAHETGFLLGWIPASVSNDAAGDGPRQRQSGRRSSTPS